MEKKVSVMFLCALVAAGGFGLYKTGSPEKASGLEVAKKTPASALVTSPDVPTPLSVLSDAELQQSGS
jgi:hypothetical protein